MALADVPAMGHSFEIQLNVIFANIPQVLSMRQQCCLQPSLCSLQQCVDALITQSRHTETVTFDDGSHADVSVVNLDAAALILLPADSDDQYV